MLAGRRTLLGGAIGAHRVMVTCWGSAYPARSFAGEIKEWVVSETLQCLRKRWRLRGGVPERFDATLCTLKSVCRKIRRWSLSDWRWIQIVQAAREELSRSLHTMVNTMVNYVSICSYQCDN